MYEKILVALDPGPGADAVFAQAVALARSMPAALMLVHSLSGEEQGRALAVPPAIGALDWATGTAADMELWQQEWARYQGPSLDRLRHLASQASLAGLEVEFRQLIDHPGKAICKTAQSWGADLIVMGRCDRTDLTEAALGSVASYVMHRAPCSVLLVKTAVAQAGQPSTLDRSLENLGHKTAVEAVGNMVG